MDIKVHLNQVVHLMPLALSNFRCPPITGNFICGRHPFLARRLQNPDILMLITTAEQFSQSSTLRDKRRRMQERYPVCLWLNGLLADAWYKTLVGTALRSDPSD
jgi:hypothetical protein